MAVRLQFHQQQTLPNGNPLPLFRGTGAARAIGGGIARLGANLAQGQREYEAKAERQQAQDAATMALRITAETRSDFANRMTELQENGEPGLPGFAGTIAGEYRQHMDQALESVPEWARQRVQRSLLVYGDSLSQQALGVETKARWNKRADDLTAGIKSTVDTVERSPGEYRTLRSELVSGIEESQLPPAMRQAAMKEVDRLLPGAYARGLIAANPAAVAGSFNSRFESSDSVINSLPMQERMRIKARADQVLNSRMASARSDLSNRAADHAAAIRAGRPETVKPPSREEFQAAYGLVKGGVKYLQYQEDVDFAHLVKSMEGMDAEQLEEVRRSAHGQIRGEDAAEAEQLLIAVDKQIARIGRDREKAASEERRELAVDMETNIAAAMEGEEPDRLSLDRFTASYTDPREAQKAYREYIGALDALAMAKDIQDDDPAEAREKIATRFQSAYEIKQRADLMGEVDKLKKRREADPAGEVLKFSEPAQQAWLEYQSTESFEDRRSAARQYIGVMEEEQERIGVPADKRRLLPDGFVRSIKAELAEAMSPENANGEKLAATLQTLRLDFDDRWPEVSAELMAEGAIKDYAIPIASGMDPAAAMTLAKAAGMKRNEFNLKQGDAKAIDDAVRREMADYSKTLSPLFGVVDGLDLFAAHDAAAKRLADVYVSTGIEPEAAAKRAVEEAVTGRYDFKDTWRVPKQAAVNAGGFDLIKTGADEYKEEFAADRIPASGTPQQQADTRKVIVSGSKWITAPDERGLILTYDGQAIPDAEGNPIALSWDALADVGRAYYERTNWLERRF